MKNRLPTPEGRRAFRNLYFTAAGLRLALEENESRAWPPSAPRGLRLWPAPALYREGTGGSWMRVGMATIAARLEDGRQPSREGIEEGYRYNRKFAVLINRLLFRHNYPVVVSRVQVRGFQSSGAAHDQPTEETGSFCFACERGQAADPALLGTAHKCRY